MKNCIKYLFCLLLSVFAFCGLEHVNATEYGVSCWYEKEGDNYFFSYTGLGIDDVFEFDTNFDELGVLIEADRPGKALKDITEQTWLTEKGMLSPYADGMKLTCPINPFGTDLGNPTKVIDDNAYLTDFSIIPIQRSYTCTYKGQKHGNKLIISFEDGTFNVTYPDGTIKSENLMLDEDCGMDIYYVAEDKLIKQVVGGDTISNNDTLLKLCREYENDQIEHFCSNGNCKISNMSCENIILSNNSSSGTCPSMLLPIFRLIRKILTPIVSIALPILLILMGSIDLGKAVMASDDRAMKETASKFLRRCIAAVAVFFVVTIVTILMNMLSKVDEIGEQNGWKSCWNEAGK